MRVATEIVVLAKENPVTWAYVPALCARIRTFCATYASEADPDQVIRLYQQQFVQETPQLIGLVALQEHAVVAHLLVSLDWWMGTRLATILQYAQDHGCHIPPAQLQEAFVWLRQWAKGQGAVALQCLARHPALVKAFQRYGFAPTACLLRQPC